MHKQLITTVVAVGVLVITAGLCAEKPKPKKPLQPAARHGKSRLGAKALTETQQKELLTALKEARPELHDRLTSLRDDNPAAYQRALARAWRWYQRTRNLSPGARKASIGLAKTRARIWRLVVAIRKAPDSKTKEGLVTELRQAVAEQFDAEQTLRENRLAQLEQEIKQLRLELKERANQRNQLVTERVKRYLKATTRPSRTRRPGRHLEPEPEE